MALKRPKLNRSSAQSARGIVKNLFSDPKIRRQNLELLREAALAANEEDARSWGITLAPSRVRLNVGRGAVLTLEKNAVSPAVSREELLENARDAARKFGENRIQNPSWRAAHSSGFLDFLREEFGQTPDPQYAPSPPIRANEQTPSDLKTVLREAVADAGLQLSDEFVGAFFTGLQAKGFVILRGPSGVGKSRLALVFAELLEANSDFSAGETVAIDSAFRVGGRLVLPPNARRFARDGAAVLMCAGAPLPAKIEGQTLTFRGATRRCVLESLGQDEEISVEAELDENGAPLFRFLPVSRASSPRNRLFLPVQSSWSDSKSLLGYFNPLLSRYEWTPFLRFLLEARASFERGENRVFLAVLDEMNLARVEHYFADFLAVLESGRDVNGVSREPVRFEFDPRSSGELPPRELFLPPNLAFVGTLNDDETAFALSPKVLDRAFVLSAPCPDFSTYQPVRDDFKLRINQEKRAQIVEKFGVRGRNSTKVLAAKSLENWPQQREILADVNAILARFELGFGFRAFDEIVAFTQLARENGLLETQIALEIALTAKVAPRFSGAALGLEEPLRAVFAWANERGLKRFSLEIGRKLARLERDGWG